MSVAAGFKLKVIEFSEKSGNRRAKLECYVNASVRQEKDED